MKIPFLFLCLLCPLHATVLLNDTFSDGARNDANLPSSGNWILTGSGAVGGTATSTVTGGALVTQSNAGLALATAFNSHALAAGETITLSFSVTLAFNGTAASDSFRFGLYNSGGSFPSADSAGTNGANTAFNAWTGYSYWSPYGTIAGANATIRERTGTDDILFAGGANSSRNTASYTSGSVTNGTTYQGSFSVTNNGSSLAITATLGSTTQSWTDNSPTATTFDSLAFFAGGTPLGSAGSFTLDNVMVEVVPEPSALLLGTLAPLSLLRRKRTA